MEYPGVKTQLGKEKALYRPFKLSTANLVEFASVKGLSLSTECEFSISKPIGAVHLLFAIRSRLGTVAPFNWP